MRRLLSLALALALVACQPKPDILTTADFDAIANGQTLEDVRHILGQDGVDLSKDGSGTVYGFPNHEDVGGVITVLFINGKVLSKSQSGLPNP